VRTRSKGEEVALCEREGGVTTPAVERRKTTGPMRRRCRADRERKRRESEA